MSLVAVKGDLSVDTSNVYVDGVKSDLSVQHIEADDYYDLVAEGGCLSNVIYVVDASCKNMYGEKISNLGAPEVSSDAATKAYVDSAIASIDKKISSLSSTSGDSLTSQIKSELRSIVKDFLGSFS